MLSQNKGIRSLNLSVPMIVAFSVLVITGCDQVVSPAEYAPVRVSVLLDDEPLEKARVVLIPIDYEDAAGEAVPMAQGETDESGTCVLSTTDDKNESIMVTSYRVIVLKPLEEASQTKFIRRRSGTIQNKLGTPRFAMFQGKQDEIGTHYNQFSEIVVTLEPKSGVCEVELNLQSRSR